MIGNSSRPFCDGDRCRVSGDNQGLDAERTIALGMIFHELFTNAMKYGALSNADGYVVIASRLSSEAGGAVVDIDWREHGGPPVAEPSRKGFGATLMETLARQMGGSIVRNADPDGLFVKLRFKQTEARAVTPASL